MSKIALVTDSTIALPQNLVIENHLHIVPLSVIWDGKTYLDGIEMTPATFYERLAGSSTNPSTSQPSPEAFREVFQALLDQGYEILCVTISAKLSGTFDSAQQALVGLPAESIRLVDSQTASLPLGMVALELASAIAKGISLDDAEALAKDLCARTEVFFALDTLEYLHRGGRIGGAAKLMGTLLGLKPILTIKNGVVEALDKVRTSKRARERIVEMMVEKMGEGAKVRFIGVTAAGALTEAQNVLADAQAHFNAERSILAELSPVIGTHGGPGTIGLVCIPEA